MFTWSEVSVWPTCSSGPESESGNHVFSVMADALHVSTMLAKPCVAPRTTKKKCKKKTGSTEKTGRKSWISLGSVWFCFQLCERNVWRAGSTFHPGEESCLDQFLCEYSKPSVCANERFGEDGAADPDAPPLRSCRAHHQHTHTHTQARTHTHTHTHTHTISHPPRYCTHADTNLFCKVISRSDPPRGSPPQSPRVRP